MNKGLLSIVLLAGLSWQQAARAQSPWVRLAERPSTLGLEQGRLSLETPSFTLELVKASQTVAALRPKTAPDFDFTPGDSLQVRSSDGMYHLGDINLRLRTAGETGWQSYSTARHRQPVQALPVTGDVLAAADLAATLPADIPVQVKRSWLVQDGKLVLSFALTNKTSRPVEIGALGIPMIFNNILSGKTLEQAHAHNVFYDPSISRDAGYLQVTRLSGHSPSLVVVPVGHTPFEAYNPLLDDPTPRNITFEGFYEWMVYSEAYAQKEWKAAEPWNTPTAVTLQPGATVQYGVALLLTGGPREIEQTLVENKRPVVVGIPGYVLPEAVDGKLFIRYPQQVRSMTVEPAGALEIDRSKAASKDWTAYVIRGHAPGRARLTITYKDGLVQTVQYKVLKRESSTINDYGDFLTHQQWFEQKDDPFHRSPGVISYDDEKKAQVIQDSRAWICGMSDEGGAGGWLGATMKQLVMPDKEQVDKLQHFIDETVWGNLQYSEGPQQYGVKKSLFFYEPDSMPAGTYQSDVNFKTWAAWPVKEAFSVGRSYNYPHVTAAYWVMYRLARNYTGLVKAHEWNWYLEHAYHTAMGMVQLAPYYAQFGQMEGTVFYLLLKDLQAEGMTTMADALEAAMKKRALHWHTLEYPFGSEMPWDSTGQEEVYIWSLFFGFTEKAEVTLNAILAYMPAIPGWAYNGNARRYWDFLYGGKLSRIERMIHHYGSELNAIPVLTAYRNNPDDFYLLRVGYGGVLGGISNITTEGFAPCAFHSFPSTLKNDGLSGDYGSGFFGYAVNTATYITKQPEFGWLAFGGNLEQKKQEIKVAITTAAKSAVYIAPAGLWLNLEAGRIKTVIYNEKTGTVTLTLEPATEYTPEAWLKVEQPAREEQTGYYGLDGDPVMERGMYRIQLGAGETTIRLMEGKG